MPTGYTAKLAEGEQPFEEFVWQCARAFGALINMRDEPMNAPIPERFEPADWERESLEKAKAELARYQSMTDGEAQQEADAKRAEAVKYREDYIAKNAITRNRYNAMLARVMEWQPPTPDHGELKRFMVEQLARARDFDTAYEPAMPEELSGAVYRAEMIADRTRQVASREQYWAEEVKRTEDRNAWVRALRDSLKQPVAA